MADLSTYITIANQTPYTMSNTDKTTQHGSWVIPPPYTIDAWKACQKLQLKDPTGAAAGSEGTITYTITIPGHQAISDPMQPPGADFETNMQPGSGLLTTDNKIITFTMKFCDSWSANNNYCYFTSTDLVAFSTYFLAKSGAGGWVYGGCPESGHPLTLHFGVRMLGRT